MLRLLPLLLVTASLFAQVRTPQPFQLPTGLNCLLVEDHERPLVRMALTVRWDPALEPLVQSGQVGFLTRLLASSGAGPYSREAFKRAAAELGLAYAFEGRRAAFNWSLVTDSRSLEPAFELLANAVFRADFGAPDVEAQRQSLIRRATAESLREGAIARLLWQLQDPKAIQVPGGAGLDRMALPSLLTLQRRLLRPEHAQLVLYGDLNLAQAKELASLHLGVWGPAPVTEPIPAEVPEPAARTFTALLESGTQPELWAGSARTGTGAPGVEALLAILLERSARAASGELELAFTLQPDGPLLLKAQAGGATRDQLVPGLMALLEALRSRGFTGEELSRAKVQWRSTHLTLPLHPEALVHSLLRKGPGPDPEAAIAALTLAEVNQALTAWLEPARLRYLMLNGDATMLKAAEQAGLGTAALVRAQ